MIARGILLALVALLAAPPVAAKPSAVEQLHQLFAQDWERNLQENPEGATFLGDARFNDRCTDMSLPAIEARDAADRAVLEQLARIPRAKLPAAEQVNYDLFKQRYEIAVAYQRFKMHEVPLDPIGFDGFGSAATLPQIQPFATADDYEKWVRRLQAYGALVDQNMALMRLGMASGRVPPREPMTRLLEQLAAFAPDRPEDSPFYAPFRRIASGIAAADAERLRAQGAAAIRDVVTPAWRRFNAFYEKEYLPACRATIAAEAYPDGAAFYALRVRHMTTTTMTPDEVHAVGLAEVARIRAEMEKIREQVKFKGDLAAFFRHLRSDKRFYFKTGDELLRAYRDIAKRIDPQLVRLFGRLPRTPYGVEAVPELEAPNQTTAYYRRPSEDGSRAGYFYANLYKPETRPKWEMEALTVHEAVPGHHLQIALAQELGELPKFRRLGGYTAFVEGWGLYSESLGEELGLYRDPYSKFGQLTYEMWRAVRLVVDTGMHHKGWTRQQAIDYFSANAAKTANDIAVEVDRYISWPGQALAYKIGELRIKALRARARDALGDRFDVRRFHDTVLGNGAVPLDVLEATVDRWIAAGGGAPAR
jgi:prolyl oligopeptidase